MVAAVANGPSDHLGVAGTRLRKVYDLAQKYQDSGSDVRGNSGRGPVKSRLGFRPSERLPQTHSNQGSQEWNFRQPGGQYGRQRQWTRPDYSQMTCNFCGVKGHIRKKCFKLKNLNRDAVNLVESYRPGPSADRHITELLERMRTRDDEDDDSDSDMRWKRGRNGPQSTDQDL
ncbi:uncharacterized protein LOC134207478 [Armigeres subalbatus]|uniref:uncharacterized protein LOC134207478 n=1 Tax=Armigeres subalbatus TaxID=124917 RepID=UPI002ED2EBB7